MHDDKFLDLDRVPIDIKRKLECFSEKAAKEYEMVSHPWYHDVAICVVERKEAHFRRSIQISLCKDKDDKEHVIFIPNFEEYLGKKRRMMSQIPERFILKIPFSDLSESSFGRVFREVITFSYFITPAMFDREDEIA